MIRLCANLLGVTVPSLLAELAGLSLKCTHHTQHTHLYEYSNYRIRPFRQTIQPDRQARRCCAMLERRRRGSLVPAPVCRSAVPRAAGAPRAFRPECGATIHPAVDQDRRMLRGLRLLPAIGLPFNRCGEPQDAGTGCGTGRGARRQTERGEPFLHGRRMARTQRPGYGKRGGNGQGGARPGHGDLRHAGHAERQTDRTIARCRSGLLQPQPGYLAGILRRHHQHARLPGPPRHA